MKKKKWIVLIIVFLAIAVTTVTIRATRVAYFGNFACNVPTVSDADFLGVSDVRLLRLFGDEKSEEQLKDLVREVMKKSYSDSNSQNPYREIMDDAVYMRLNPKYRVDAEVRLLDVKVECFAHEDKAIVYWSKDCCYDAKEDIVNCKINTDHMPYDRLYFEKIDGEWRTVDFFRPA